MPCNGSLNLTKLFSCTSIKLQVSLVAVEESFILVSGVHTSVPCDDTLEYDKSSSRVLILQVSLVIKIELVHAQRTVYKCAL